MNQLIGDVKKALDEIKRLKGRVDSFSSGSTLIINGSGGTPISGVLLSDDDPEPVGVAPDPGNSTEASRSNHVHEGATAVGQYRQFVYTGDNPFQFVVDGDGQPVFALLDLE